MPYYNLHFYKRTGSYTFLPHDFLPYQLACLLSSAIFYLIWLSLTLLAQQLMCYSSTRLNVDDVLFLLGIVSRISPFFEDDTFMQPLVSLSF